MRKIYLLVLFMAFLCLFFIFRFVLLLREVEVPSIEVYPDDQKINMEVTPVQEWPVIEGEDKG